MPCYGSGACAHLRSHSGIGAGLVFTSVPTASEFTIPPEAFRCLLLERLRLPLQFTERLCEGCGRDLDARGCHRAACPRSGRLRIRAGPMERMIARVCREAGATVRWNVYLRDLNVGVRAADERRLEILAQGLPCFNGVQLAVDATLRCALSTSGAPRPRAAREDGAALDDARVQKEQTYPELVGNGQCQLVVLGFETGGRWSAEAYAFVWELAKAKARGVPTYLRFSAALAWQKRWMTMISVATFTSFAHSLILPKQPLACAGIQAADVAPDLADLFGRDAPLGGSHLPLRG